MTKEQQYSLEIYQALTTLFDEDNENFKYDLSNIDLTEFMTGFTMAFALFYDQVTNSDTSLIDSIGLQNKLLFQYMIANGKLKDNEEETND